MFIDEMFENLLINEGKSLARAIHEILVEKLDNTDRNFESVKRIEAAYQLFRKRHPTFQEDAFRLYVKTASPEIAKHLKYD